MAESGENYTAFNSRALVEVVGDVTDEALKATKIKQLLSVLAGRFFNWGGRKSLFTLHLGIKCCAIEMAAAATPRPRPRVRLAAPCLLCQLPATRGLAP